MSAYFSENGRASVITKDGRLVIAKQAGGLTLNVIGCALVKDKANWLNNLCKNGDSYDFAKLADVTYADLTKNCNIIFKNVTYKYDNDMHTPSDPNEYAKAVASPVEFLYPVTKAYDKTKDKFIVKFSILSGLITENSDGNDKTFDAVIYFAKPYIQDIVNKNTSIEQIVDKQNPTLFAIEYFAEEKPMICDIDHIMLGINVEYDLLDNTDVSSAIPDGFDSGANTLHRTNNGNTNKMLESLDGVGTTDNVFMSLVPNEKLYGYDTFAKLNIMTSATSAVNDAVPQLMFSVANADAEKSWDGRSVTFTYCSAGYGSLFRVIEQKGRDKGKINFELFGSNNLYRNVPNTYGNSFIYSEENEISPNSNSNLFLNSDRNSFASIGNEQNTFIESSDNYFGDANNTGNISNNTFITTSEATLVSPENKTLQGQTFINSNFIAVSGEGRSNSVYINAPSGKHIMNDNDKQNVCIGGAFGYTKDNACDVITIGRGLECIGAVGQGKVILGAMNQNVTDPDEILVVGDGFIRNEYIDDHINDLKNINYSNKFFDDISGTGDISGGFYRHNLFTVNRNGWCTISDYNTPSVSARYGTRGISAYDGDILYDISFAEIAARLKTNDAVADMNNEYNRLTAHVNNLLDSHIMSYRIFLSTQLASYDTEYSLSSVEYMDNASIAVINDTNRQISVISETMSNGNSTTVTTVLQQGENARYIFKGADKNNVNAVWGFFKID